MSTISCVPVGSSGIFIIANAVDNALVKLDGTDGDTLQVSGITIDDSDNMSGVTTINGVTIETHASRHAVGGDDTIFPADPGADKVLTWDNDAGDIAWGDAMTYPGAGIAVSTGLAWDTSISSAWLDQDVSQDGSPTFADLTLSGGLYFGDGDTGFNESVVNRLRFVAAGVDSFELIANQIRGDNGNQSPNILNEQSTSTNPVYTFRGDADTGLGWAAADQLSLIAGGVEGIRITESTTIDVNILGYTRIGDTTVPSYLLDLAQQADNNGIRISGYDNKSSSTVQLYIDDSGHTNLIATDNLYLKATQSSKHMLFDTGGAWYFRDSDSGYATRMSLDSATGILSLPEVYNHDMNGETIRDLQINDSGELGYSSSSIRNKIDIIDINDTSWIYDLRPVTYSPRNNINKRLNGLIAEEVEKINNQLIWYNILDNGEKQVDGVDYKSLIIPMLNEIKKLKKKIDDLTNG